MSKPRQWPAIQDFEIEQAKYTFRCRTRRGQQDGAYAQRAINVLYNDDDGKPYSHFLPSRRDVESDKQDLPLGILRELGRCDYDRIREIAKEICEQKLSKPGAIEFIKSHRGVGQKLKPVNQLELLEKLEDTFNRYSKSHEPDGLVYCSVIAFLLQSAAELFEVSPDALLEIISEIEVSQ